MAFRLFGKKEARGESAPAPSPVAPAPASEQAASESVPPSHGMPPIAEDKKLAAALMPMTGRDIYINPSPSQAAVRSEARIRRLVETILDGMKNGTLDPVVALNEHLPELERLAWSSGAHLNSDWLKKVQKLCAELRAKLED